MRGLDQRDQQSGPDRTDVRNLAQQFRGSMFSALGQQILPHGLAQSSQSIELLVEELGPPAHAGFPDLVQPIRAMAWCVDLLTPTENAPTSIQSLDTIHHTAEIFADRQITAGQLLHSSKAVLPMVDRAQIST